jgi:hypothetical protein
MGDTNTTASRLSSLYNEKVVGSKHRGVRGKRFGACSSALVSSSALAAFTVGFFVAIIVPLIRPYQERELRGE